MNSSFDNEIFKYLSKEENFSYAFEIHRFYPEVAEKLVKEFWCLVKGLLEDLTKNEDWQVYSEDMETSYPKLGLKSPQSGIIRVIYEKLQRQTYYGVWIDINDSKYRKLDTDQIYSYFEINKPDIYERSLESKDYWIIKINTDYDFNINNLNTLKKILPDNRDQITQELAQTLLCFANDLKEDIEKMSKMKIK